MRVNMRRMTPGAVFNSFLGILDLKLDCASVRRASIHAEDDTNKLTADQQGRRFATLWAFLWALSVIKLEVAKKSLFVAHLYVIDHAIAWVFHYIFYYAYWYTLKHDGTRVLNSQAQKDIFELALSREETEPLDAGRDKQAQLAHEIWNKEKGYALGVIAVGFLLKVYFIFLMYSYAAHLRSGTYHQLPLTTHANQVTQIEARRASLAATALDEEIEMERALADVERIERGARASEEAVGSPRTSPRMNTAGNGAAATGGRPGKSRDSDEFSWD
ncbi:hypothetical protein A1Q2_00362 [Trichosporon asahii var. asahii CBS 8904]|uniref:Uncharacterized protein n=1 Tax=Trichosporon asahii var. asahii (strain CBS 8904) TaxID=1220162 RepID=K1W935_TRIAC|nr:hypothetical protein A1Q2_00362 [Trichosporon asahii var. asahii CBS 8904]